jgi:hypothetical protein
MRFNLRLHGRAADGRRCQADVSVYADSRKELQRQASRAAAKAAWLAKDPPHDPIPEGAQITVEHVERI